MARPLRIEYPGAYYHVMNRGIAREAVFPATKDKEKFLEYLSGVADRFATLIHAYCIMGNHYHLLLQTPQANLSSAIQWLNVSYAVFYNRLHDRSGHVFGGRFKALLIEAEEYLTSLSRYIHLNPVRAGIVRRPQDYPWSSYPALVGSLKGPDWLETRGLLSYFGGNTKEAIKGYREYVEEVDVKEVTYPSKHALGGVVLGGKDFVKWIQETFVSARREEKEIPQLRAIRPRISVETIVQAVCKEFDCAKEKILAKGLQRNRAREIAIFLSRSHSGVSSKNLGKFFGGVSGAAITMSCTELNKGLARDKRLQDKMKRIEKEILNF
ncbi:MAG: transposase [Fidelibacterota bacterium]